MAPGMALGKGRAWSACKRWGLAPPPWLQVTAQEKIASSCIREGLIKILGIFFFVERVVKHWKRLPREVTESAPLKMFKNLVDVAVEGMVYMVVVLG